MRNILFICCAALLVAFPSMADSDALAVLKSNASVEAKTEACLHLSVYGGTEAIPALEELLSDNILSHMARYALEPMAGEEVDQALLRALAKTSGTVKAGIIASLGVRKTEAAIDAFIEAVKDDHLEVQEAAIRALGQLANHPAVLALEDASLRPDQPVAIREAIGESLLLCAEAYFERIREDHAAGIYEYVYFSKFFPIHVRAAGLRGAARTHETDAGWKLLARAFQSDEPAFFDMALRLALEVTPRQRTAARLVHLLPEYKEVQKIEVIQTLGELGVKKSGQALLREAMAGKTEIRIAALRAVTRLGFGPALPLITSLAVSQDEALMPVARECLAYFPGEGGDVILEGLLKNEDPATRQAAVEMVAMGGLPNICDRLLYMARRDKSSNVRLAAIQGAVSPAEARHLSEFVRHLLRPQSKEERSAAEDALKSIATRNRKTGIPDGVVRDLVNALNRGGAQQSALVSILTATGTQRAFDALLTKCAAEDETLRTEATKAICDWPLPLAIPTLLEWVEADGDNRAQAFKGLARLLASKEVADGDAILYYQKLFGKTKGADEKKVLLSGLANLRMASALALALDQFEDKEVQTEAGHAIAALVRIVEQTEEGLALKEKAYALLPDLKQD